MILHAPSSSRCVCPSCTGNQVSNTKRKILCTVSHCFSLSNCCLPSGAWYEDELFIWPCMTGHKLIVFLIKLTVCMWAFIENHWHFFATLHLAAYHFIFRIRSCFLHLLFPGPDTLITLSSVETILKCSIVGKQNFLDMTNFRTLLSPGFAVLDWSNY